MDPNSAGVKQWIASGGFGAQTIEGIGDPTLQNCSIACRIGKLRKLQLAFLNSTRLGIPLSFVIETSHCGAAGGAVASLHCTPSTP